MQHCVFHNRQTALIKALEGIDVRSIILQSPDKGEKKSIFLPKVRKNAVLAGQQYTPRFILVPISSPSKAEYHPMLVEIIADITCPWCFIGLKRLQQALAMRPSYDPTFVWRPFLLNPDLLEGAIDRKQYLSRVFGSESRIQQFQEAIDTAGRAVGIPFDFLKADFTPSSLRPHRFILFAARQVCPLIAADTLYSAFFTEGHNIGEVSPLLTLAGRLGLDINAVEEHLTSDRGAQTVLDENAKIHRLGVNGVPSYVFGKRNIISGAQEPQTLVNMLDFNNTAEKLEQNNDERPQWA